MSESERACAHSRTLRVISASGQGGTNRPYQRRFSFSVPGLPGAEEGTSNQLGWRCSRPQPGTMGAQWECGAQTPHDPGWAQRRGPQLTAAPDRQERSRLPFLPSSAHSSSWRSRKLSLRSEKGKRMAKWRKEAVAVCAPCILACDRFPPG